MFGKKLTKTAAITSNVTRNDLVIPPRPASIDKAKADLALAERRRREAEQAHVQAVTLLGQQKPGTPQSITAAEADEIAAKIKPTIEAEAAARERLREKSEAYQAEVWRALVEPISAARSDIVGHLDAITAALTRLHQLKKSADELGVALPSKLPGAAPPLSVMIEPIRKHLERLA